MTIGIKVLQDKGRDVRGLLKNERIYEDKFLPIKEGKFIIFPMRERPTNLERELKPITKDFWFGEFEFRENSRTRSFRRELQKILPKDLYNDAARAYEQIGDIGIITIFPDMEPYEKKIALALKETNKGIRIVIKKISKHEGKNRIQGYKTLTGEGTTETIHIENGVQIKVDIAKVYYSSRTMNERKRVAACVKSSEDILVLFAGCSPFPLVLSKNTPANNIVAIELNEDAHNYAKENIKLNNLNNIQLIHGDVREELKLLTQKFDRIIMPHPTEADYYLKDALYSLKKRGVVHMYLFSKPEKINFVETKIQNICEKMKFFIKKIEVIEQMHISFEVTKYCFDIHLIKKKE
jgi:tRNA (guanine37-N1)-methyltransferase